MSGAHDQQVVVVSRGEEASWRAGVFAGCPRLAGPARFAALVGVEVPIGDELVIADDLTALGALAALMSADPGATRIVSAPPELERCFAELLVPTEPQSPGVLGASTPPAT